MCYTIIIPLIYLFLCYISYDLRIDVVPLLLSFLLGFVIDIGKTIVDGVFGGIDD